jgi:hypothetical protein
MTADKLASIKNISNLLLKRREEIRGLYDNIPMPSDAELSGKDIAVAITETIAESYFHFGEKMTALSNAGRKWAFFYGDKFKDKDDARKFIIAAGYKGKMENVELIHKDKDYETLVNAIAGKELSADNVGVIAAEGELKIAGKATNKIPGTLLQIQPIEINGQTVYYAANSVQILLKMMLEGELPPDVTKDERIAGLYRYLPRTMPIDYEKEVRNYIEAIAVIRTAA